MISTCSRSFNNVDSCTLETQTTTDDDIWTTYGMSKTILWYCCPQCKQLKSLSKRTKTQLLQLCWNSTHSKFEIGFQNVSGVDVSAWSSATSSVDCFHSGCSFQSAIAVCSASLNTLWKSSQQCHEKRQDFMNIKEYDEHGSSKRHALHQSQCNNSTMHACNWKINHEKSYLFIPKHKPRLTLQKSSTAETTKSTS